MLTVELVSLPSQMDNTDLSFDDNCIILDKHKYLFVCHPQMMDSRYKRLFCLEMKHKMDIPSHDQERLSCSPGYGSSSAIYHTSHSEEPAFQHLSGLIFHPLQSTYRVSHPSLLLCLICSLYLRTEVRPL